MAMVVEKTLCAEIGTAIANRSRASANNLSKTDPLSRSSSIVRVWRGRGRVGQLSIYWITIVHGGL